MSADPQGEAVAAWLRHRDPALFPYGRVVREIRRGGKEALDRTLLARLAEARAALAGRPGGATGAAAGELLAAFLGCALDKHDGRYRYQSYLGLPLLDPLVRRWRRPGGAGLLVGLLVADALRHELAVRPDDPVRRKRLRHGLRLLARHVPGTERGEPAAGSGDAPDPAAAVDALAPVAAPEAARRIELSMQPVSGHADEYLFVRVLQSYETVFAALVRDTRAARDRLRRDRPEAAAGALAAAASHFDRAGLLFSLLATMDVAVFRDFRPQTEGASAIQSERYKVFELLCGSPPAERLRSPAFTSVPGLAAGPAGTPRADGDGSISAWYLGARARGAFGPAQWALLDAALARLERSHQLWKTAHHAIAARLIGDAPGSGYTEGVPYLRGCLENRLFWRLGDRYLPHSRPGPEHATGPAADRGAAVRQPER